jgi:hypothetical protein
MLPVQIKLILQVNWLPCSAPFYKIGGFELPVPCADGDWVLVVVRVLPFVLVSFTVPRMPDKIMCSCMSLA